MEDLGIKKKVARNYQNQPDQKKFAKSGETGIR